ncbi:putative homeodomain transcription factor [Dermatophagoides farinae]|uniref:putative homeodomain transcription factor n=1 Tax=Dermatophagoides farinae TaxID=6954 RepID=UPI003F63DA1D
MSSDCNNKLIIDDDNGYGQIKMSTFMAMKFAKTFIRKYFPNIKINASHNHDKGPPSPRLDELFNFNPMASQLISSYQKKICHYDKQQWDRTSAAITMTMTPEDQIISRTDHMTTAAENKPSTCTPSQRSSNKSNSTTTAPNNIINADLIDLDLISGSAYTMKSKSQQGWISMLFQAILRVVFFPLYLRWWAEQTSACLVALLFILYIMQIISIRFYYQKNLSTFNNTSFTNSSSTSNSMKSNEFAEISATEVLMPIAMMIVLGIIHTQIVGTKSFKSSSSSSSSSSGSSSSYSMNNHSNLSSTNNVRKTHHHHHSSSHQTDCSSTSGNSSSSSSTSSSVDSSPVANVRQRIQNRMARLEKFKNDDKHHSSNSSPTNSTKPPLPKTNPINLPKIRFFKENENQTINRSFDADDDNMMHDFPVIPPRKRADSLPKSWSKNKLRKPSRLRISKSTRHSLTSSWSYDDDHLNSSPVSLRSSLYGSSIDSEGTISPMTPTILQGDEWPAVQSDASSDEENNNAHHDDAYHSGDYYQNHSGIRNSQQKIRHRQSTSIDGDCGNQDQTSNLLNKSDKTSQINMIENGPTNMQSTTPATTTSVQTASNELKVSCSLWQHNVCQKFDLSVVDISSSIIRKVETVEHSNEYIYLGILFSLTVSLIPSIYRLQYSTKDGPSIAQILNSSSLAAAVTQPVAAAASMMPADVLHLSDLYGLWNFFLDEAFYFNRNTRVRFVIITALIERFVLSLIFFFLLCVTERTFKQRFLYSKYFSHITRRDRAKRSQIPHFRLHKVRNLKVWLSVRSYLRRYGPHRSVDTICSTTFIMSICLLTCISLQILKDSNESCTTRLICWEMIFWSLAMGIYIMRLMILGSRINQKYRSNLSVLITEQINLYLQLERKPHKKDALMLANQVLKLAVDLLKELESPYKISGFSANPYLYNITKVVVLSAFSAVLTEMLGFKLKLYKIKLIR